MKLARVLGAIGRTLITAGVLILLFVAYQLWGTGVRQRQAQDRLEKQFTEKLEEAQGATVNTLPVNPAEPLGDAIPEGDPVGRIEIPKVGLDAIVVEGVGTDDLKKGPGHYPETPLPGQRGNAAIAGHRTTYGAPFAEIDELAPGDKIHITTVQGRFTYGVIDPDPADGEVKGHFIVSPNQSEVLLNTDDNRLTLTACHPKYSLAQRIIVVGILEGEPAPTTQKPRALESGLGGKRVSIWPAILFALLCALIWLLSWIASKKWRKWPPYAIGLPLFLVSLFLFFENFSRLLPSNF